MNVYATTDKFDFDVSFTGIELPLEVLEKAFAKGRPVIYFNDLDCYYWMFDFPFEWNGQRYWFSMTSKHDPWIHGATIEVYQ